MRLPRTIAGPVLVAATLAGIYLVWAPQSQDLAASTFRAELFAEHGFVIWSNAWYSGHHLLSYSVLYPPLAAALGVRLVGALAVVASAALFAALAERRFGERALVPALWFAAAVACWLVTGRMPFLLAVAFGLGALVAVDRDRHAIGAGLAALCSLASPVAGLFVAIAGAAVWLAGGRAPGTSLVLGAAIPIAALNVAFPVGGEEPFVASAFVAVPLLAAAVLWLVPAEHRALRIGAFLYALLALAAFVIPNPLGGNITRLGALFAGPTLALVLWPRGRVLVTAVAVPLLYWQLIAPVRDVGKGVDDPATERAYYEPLLAELDRLAVLGEPFRIQIPPTKNRWEATYVAPEYPLARGWLRQLESDDFELFSDGSLDAASYRRWLDEHGVSYVAVPEAERDYLAEDEVELIDAGLSYLDPIWEDGEWRLYAVERPAGLATDGAEVVELGADWFELEVEAPGRHRVRIRWSRYWSVAEGAGCVEESDGWTDVVATRPGVIRVEARLSGERCSG